MEVWLYIQNMHKRNISFRQYIALLIMKARAKTRGVLSRFLMHNARQSYLPFQKCFLPAPYETGTWANQVYVIKGERNGLYQATLVLANCKFETLEDRKIFSFLCKHYSF